MNVTHGVILSKIGLMSNRFGFVSYSETAENIGYSCQLLTDNMKIHYGEDVKCVSADVCACDVVERLVSDSRVVSLSLSVQLRNRQTQRRNDPQGRKKKLKETFFTESGKNALVITGGWLVRSSHTDRLAH